MPERMVSKCRVLVVEDHEDTLRVLQRLLDMNGYETTTATTVASALEACDHELPDVLLSDLQLPDGSGLELVRSLRARGDVRCIALTGHGMREHREATEAAGFDVHLTKPISFSELTDALRRAC